MAEQNNLRVLVVDDEKSIRSFLKISLAAYGYSIFEAAKGKEALTESVSVHPDVIILDVIMPRMKGREVCRRLKSSPETKHIPVIFFTAKDSEDDVKAEFEAGADGHVCIMGKHRALLAFGDF